LFEFTHKTMKTASLLLVSVLVALIAFASAITVQDAQRMAMVMMANGNEMSKAQYEDFVSLMVLAGNNDATTAESDIVVTVNQEFVTKLTKIIEFNLNEVTELLMPSAVLFNSTIDDNLITVKKIGRFNATNKGMTITMQVPLYVRVQVSKKFMGITMKPVIEAEITLQVESTMGQTTATKAVTAKLDGQYKWLKVPKWTFISLDSILDKFIKPRFQDLVVKADKKVNIFLEKYTSA